MPDIKIEAVLAWARHTGGSSVGIYAAAEHAREIGFPDDYEMLRQAARLLFQEEMAKTIAIGTDMLKKAVQESHDRCSTKDN